MKRIGWLLLILVLGLSFLAGCDQSTPATATAFDELARWVPGDADQTFFLDLKPDGDVGRHWQRIRRQLEANPEARDVLEDIFNDFKVLDYGLDEFVVGPAVDGLRSDGSYVIAPVSDKEAVEDALFQHFAAVEWQQEAFEGKTLHLGRDPDSYQQREWLAWTVHDGFLFLTSGYSPTRYSEESPTLLRALLSLAEGDSLAALPSWKTLRGRLPENPMGLAFLNVAEQGYPPAAGDTSPGAIVQRQLEAVAFAAVPEQEGMRIEIEGVFAAGGYVPIELQILYDLPAIDPLACTGLPADTALALIGHDAPVLWPWLEDIFSININQQARLRDAIGLDLEADLLSVEGPLTGDFCLGITPPLPDQPISEGLAASQALILAPDATEAQAEGIQTAMESRGALFGPGEVEGVALQTQLGTELTGYAISYGFADGVLFLGTSPDVIGRGIVTQRRGGGMVKSAAFEAVVEALPDAPMLVAYLNGGSLATLAKANMTVGEYDNSQEFQLLEPFEAIGLGLRLQPERVDGVLYFLVGD